MPPVNSVDKPIVTQQATGTRQLGKEEEEEKKSSNQSEKNGQIKDGKESHEYYGKDNSPHNCPMVASSVE